MLTNNAQLIIEPVIERARSKPDHLAVVFISEDGAVECISAADFHRQAVQFAKALEAIGVGRGDPVVLVFRHSKMLLTSFWGSMYRGAMPSVFPYLTEKLDPDLYMQRVRRLIELEQLRAAITYPEFKPKLQALVADLGCRVLSTDDLPGEVDAGDFRPPDDLESNDIAFLQHSSGTTGLQKGVALSHRAVLNQIEAIGGAMEMSPRDAMVCWGPLYHDLGLISAFVLPLVTGNTTVLISPFHWLREPKILLWSIHNYRGSIVWMPNFAFNYCAKTIRERDIEELDLSSWRLLVSGAEPIRQKSIEMFVERFKPYGFNPNAPTAVYGMAENTLAVSLSKCDRPPDVDWVSIRALAEEKVAQPMEPGSPGSTSVVGCGYPIKGCEIRVIDENDTMLPDRRVGEFVVRSNFMFDGYYLRPDLTEKSFTKSGWYKSGDIGYMADGQLFFTGRKKDLIIVGGKNIHPEDLEEIANTVPGVYPGRVVAFSVNDERMGTEAAVMVAELKDVAEEAKIEVEREIRRRIAEQADVTLRDLRLFDHRWMIKTSSGKIARSDSREKYLKEFGGLKA